MTQAEFTKKIYNIIKDKAFISNFHLSAIAEVVEQLPTEIVPGKVLFDGMMQLDGFEGIEDDIQQMHAYTKDGVTVNLEDYYTDNGAFDDDGWDRFIKALGNLMTVEEYKNFVEVADIEWPNGTIAHYLITRDGVMHISGGLWDGDIKFETTYPFHELVIEEGITVIGNFNFSEWNQLEEVTISPSVEEIGRAAFWKCQNLKRVNLAEGLKVIGPDAFGGCKALETINFPKSLHEVWEYAFQGCDKLPVGILPEELDRSGLAFG